VGSGREPLTISTAVGHGCHAIPAGDILVLFRCYFGATISRFRVEAQGTPMALRRAPATFRADRNGHRSVAFSLEPERDSA
jgi:hypothetical protein